MFHIGFLYIYFHRVISLVFTACTCNTLFYHCVRAILHMSLARNQRNFLQSSIAKYTCSCYLYKPDLRGLISQSYCPFFIDNGAQKGSTAVTAAPLAKYSRPIISRVKFKRLIKSSVKFST